MKVAAFNGSPRKEGNTYHAIKIIAGELEKQDIEVEIFHVGNKIIRGCTACNSCIKNRNERCIIDDEVNEWIQKMKEADGIILGAPIHFASIGATMKAFLDRAMYVGSANNSLYRHKVGVGVTAVRRSGGIPGFNELNNYLNYSEMIIPTSNYWNVVYGTKPGDMTEDKEGTQTMRILGKNMAWIMNIIDIGKDKIQPPQSEKKIYTNFIR